MIIDERTYTSFPGKLTNFLEIYEARGKPIHGRFSTTLLACL